jgi:hypothetical protein
MDRETVLIPEPIAQFQRQLEQFRTTHPLRTKLAETRWQAAVALARQHGIYSVSHPLRNTQFTAETMSWEYARLITTVISQLMALTTLPSRLRP